VGVTAPAGAAVLPRWRTTPARLARLLFGLWLFGAGEALVVRSRLGAAPWTVFAEGVSRVSPVSIGVATQLTGLTLLLLWIPLRERPGLGTVLNVVVIGIALDATLLLVAVPPAAGARAALLVAGIALIGLGSGFYLGAAHGPGPRDGLMTGLHRRTGLPVLAVRAAIELTVLGLGWALGGTAGVGTLAFAVLIGPAVSLGLALTGAGSGQGRNAAPSA
jgi:uncharacterized membrane protein YczE